MEKAMKALVLVSVALFIAGCASGYSSFYTQMPGTTSELVAEFRKGPPPVAPEVERSQAFPDLEQYAQRGLMAIGYSSFNGASGQSDAGAIKQASLVGADLVVLVNPQYTGSNTSHMPITTPTAQTTQTNASATAYGPAGSATAYGTATSTTYGTTTTYVPITTERFDYGAMFFVKRRYVFGANWRDLSDVERRKLESNSGVYVLSVVNDTPAFAADVLPGDIVTKLNGQPIGGNEAATRAFLEKRGQSVDITIVRGSKEIIKTLKLAQ